MTPRMTSSSKSLFAKETKRLEHYVLDYQLLLGVVCRAEIKVNSFFSTTTSAKWILHGLIELYVMTTRITSLTTSHFVRETSSWNIMDRIISFLGRQAVRTLWIGLSASSVLSCLLSWDQVQLLLLYKWTTSGKTSRHCLIRLDVMTPRIASLTTSHLAKETSG
jgi:hypothetical protein